MHVCTDDLGLYSHPMESEPMLTPREKSPLPEKKILRGGWNPRRCIKQDSEPNTLPTEQFHHPSPPPPPPTPPPVRAAVKSRSHAWRLSFWGSFHPHSSLLATSNRLVGLVVRRPPRERKIPSSNPVYNRIFPGSSHTSDSKIGTSVATLQGAWRYRVSTGLVGPVSAYCDWVR